MPSTEVAVQVAAAVRAQRLDAIEHLGREGTLWLAVAPLWTRQAAQAARFPVPSVIDFVRQASDIGWCETRGSLRGEGAPGLRFWMRDEVRHDVLDLLSQGDSRQRLISEATLIAGRIETSEPRPGAEPGTGTNVPDALRYWAQLLSQPTPAVALVDRAAQAVDADDLPCARQLVTAGGALEPLLAGTMGLAVDRARRLLGLGSRRRQDARALDRYLDRPELSGAVDDLLRPDAAGWALHLRGVGGVGKTMLVRYLASGRYAADRNEPRLTIARVDFDFMDPDYPVRRPVQLLVELADELALYTAAAGRADQALSRFRRTAISVQESLSGAREEHASPMRNPAVLDAVDAFADTLRLLPRPLLILDTCEELAKADAGDPAAPAVSSTLAIIERIHDRAPGVRVLLAGRRRLPDRDYLRVTPVRGFTIDEATRYLTDFAARPLPADLVRAMIRQSPAAEEDLPPSLFDPQSSVVDADLPAPGRLSDRVSPFDLALYREWAEEDPKLDVRRVARGSHAYVEGRIIGRLDDPGVRRSLPVLATAGRCRVSTIAEFIGADPAVLGTRLAEQEWIEAVGDPVTHVRAAAPLALRLRSYFAEPERSAAFAAETARLATMLREQVRDAALSDVDGGELLAALRLSEPADAARLWDEIAARAAAEGRWTWLYNITRWIAGDAAVERWPTAGALRGTVLAANIAASRRVIPSFNLAASWAEVRRSADGHPDPEAADCLRTRAELGALAYEPDNEELWLAFEFGGFGRYESTPRLADVAAAAADLAHRLLDAGHEAAARRLLERAGREWSEASLPFLALINPAEPGWATPSPDAASPWDGYPELRAWLLVAFARLLADEDLTAARAALSVADAEARRAARSAAPRFWSDALLPDQLPFRVRIEQGLIDCRDDGDPRYADWLSNAQELLQAGDVGMVETIDGERFVSLCVARRLSYSVIEPWIVARWAEADEYRPGRIATSSAHDLVPPLFVSIAEAWLAAGDAQEALDHVARHRQEALDTREDEATVSHADAVTVRIARRLRLDDERALLSRLASPDDPSTARHRLADDARRALAVIYSEPTRFSEAEVTDRPAGWHAWWQCQTVPVGAVPPVLWSAEDTDTALAADIEVDLDEFGRLSKARVRQLRTETALTGWLSRPREAQRARSAQPYLPLRAELRQAVLSSESLPRYQRDTSDRPLWTGPEMPGVPPRLLAEIAFDEAELVALRLPGPAVLLFEQAATAYGEARDDTGRLLAQLARVTTFLAAQNATQPPDEAALARFHAALAETPLTAQIPFLAAGDTSESAGPWRYWARLRDEVPEPAPVTPRRTGRLASAVGYLRPLTDAAGRFAGRVASLAEDRLSVEGLDLITIGRTALVATGLGLAVAVAAALWVLVAGLPGFDPLIVTAAVAAVAAVAALIAGRWRQSALQRLAVGAAVGTAFRPSSLEFRVLVMPGTLSGDYQVDLWAQLRLPWGVPWRQWPRLLAVAISMGLAMAFYPNRDPSNGYEGRYTADQEGLTWTGHAHDHSRGPEADASWWPGAPAAGLILCPPAHAALPWERIIIRGLGPHAAGRIEWRRQVYASTATGDYRFTNVGDSLYRPQGGTAVQLDASPSWEPVYAEHYASAPAEPAQVRHAIGAAVSTSAGARLEVGSGYPDAGPRLLGTEELRAGDPSLIIIQAEPTADAEPGIESGDAAGLADEQADQQAAQELELQLALAVDLIRSAAAPAVLLLPALPAAHSGPMAEAIAGYARTAGTTKRPDPGALQAELRALLRPSVEPTVLDDIVLFINTWG
jgi:hypothetical protein